jgi:hypothetical protein
MRFYEFLAGGLAVWRLTHLLAFEDGPIQLIARLRERAGTGVLAGLMHCFYCLSLWIAVRFGLLVGRGWQEQIILWPALSAAAIAWETMVNALGRAAEVWEDSPQPRDPSNREEDDELLWKSQSNASPNGGSLYPGTSGPATPSE